MRQINHSSIRRCTRIERRSDGPLFLSNVEIVPADDRPWRSQALAGSTMDALTMNNSDAAACVRFGGARLHHCTRCGEPFLGPGKRVDMLGRLPRQAAAKAAALRLANIAFVPPIRPADERDAINPHVLLQRVSAGRLSGRGFDTKNLLSKAPKAGKRPANKRRAGSYGHTIRRAAIAHRKAG